MESEQRFQPGEVVYLAAEIGADGLIYEIGTRATVRGVTLSGLTLELSGSSADVSCPAAHVERAAEHRRRMRGAARLGMRLHPAAM
jgi:hypothetical protein